MKRLVFVILSLGLAASVSSAAPAGYAPAIDALYEQGRQRLGPQWRPLGKTHQAAVFVHTEIRKTAEGHRAVWRSHEMPFAEYVDKEHPYLSIRNRVVIDCSGARVGVTSWSYYAGQFADGPVIASGARSSPEWVDVVPDSLDAVLMKTACAPKLRAAARKATNKATSSPAASPQ